MSVDVTIEKGVFETNDNETIDIDMFFGCGSQANTYYNGLMLQAGVTHRAARTLRRAWVRDCRGGPIWDWPWE